MKDGGVKMIEAEGLGKFYGPFAAIQDVSFSIPSGQVAAAFSFSTLSEGSPYGRSGARSSPAARS